MEAGFSPGVTIRIVVSRMVGGKIAASKDLESSRTEPEFFEHPFIIGRRKEQFAQLVGNSLAWARQGRAAV
jgi:hypothetical protein